LPDRAPPSKSNPDLTMQGLADISRIVESWFDHRTIHHLAVGDGGHTSLQTRMPDVLPFPLPHGEKFPEGAAQANSGPN
jgi:hypothetical protein